MSCMTKPRIDLTNKQFGKLTVIKQVEDYVKPDGRHNTRWLCKCSCEDDKYCYAITDILTSGRKTSCGCEGKERRIENCRKIQREHPKKITPNTYDLSGSYGIGYTTKGEKFYFDLEDYDKISQYRWYKNGCGYIMGTHKTLMNRLVMNAKNDEYVDHIHHNKYDNRKSELRIVSPSQNHYNSEIQTNNTSGYTGVYYHKPSGCWVAYTKINKKQIRKYYKTKEEAIQGRIMLENECFKEYAYRNCMEESK